MPCSGCSALHGVNPNLKKKKKKMMTEFFSVFEWLLIQNLLILPDHMEDC